MKIRHISDLHLDFLSEDKVTRMANSLNNAEPVDILILAGDVAQARNKKWKMFIDIIADQHQHIFWVLGNHEYYDAQFHNVSKWIRDHLKNYPNVQLLNNQRVTFGDINFIGSTLWTDFDNRNPLVMNSCQYMMNDCNYISYGDRLMTSNDQLALHIKAKKWLFKACRYGTKAGLRNFVITHHAPSKQSIHPKYRVGEWAIINGGFCSDLDKDILNHEITHWVHGHTHTSFDYMIGDTRVMANPHGYRDENMLEFNTDNIIEV